MQTIEIGNRYLQSPSGPWLIWEPRIVDGIMAQAAQVECRGRVPVAGNRGRTAVMNIAGVLTKGGSWSGTSTAQVADMITEAASSGEYDTIVLRIDSPGGHSSGIPDAAQAIRDASSRVRVVACIEDYGLSAAYFLASQASEIYANPSAMIGSVGTLMVVPDSSKLYEEAGIKMHVFQSGELKALGAPGVPIPEAHLSEFGRIVQSINSMFLDAVQTGRKLSDEQLADIATARIYFPTEALSAGLIDGVASFSQVLDMVATNKKESRSMATNIAPTEQTPPLNEPVNLAAMVSDRDKAIQQLCPGCSAEFRLQHIAEQSTDVQVLQGWCLLQSSAIAELRSQVAQPQNQIAGSQAAAPVADLAAHSVTIVQSSPATPESALPSDTNPIQAWKHAIQEKKEAGIPGYKAIEMVMREQPGLLAAYEQAVPACR